MKLARPFSVFEKEAAAAEEWMAEQQLAAKISEEKMAADALFFAKRPKVARQVAVKEAAAAEEVVKAKPAGDVKKTKLVRVHQEYIDALLKRYPAKPFWVVPEEIIQKMPEGTRERFVATRAEIVAGVKKLRDKEEAILEQYRAKGYAEVEVEVKEGDSEGN